MPEENGTLKCKLRRADELTTEGETGGEIAAEPVVSPATRYNWRRGCGGIDTDRRKDPEELREQNARLERLLAEAELFRDVFREASKETPIQVPSAAPSTCPPPRWACRNG